MNKRLAWLMAVILTLTPVGSLAHAETAPATNTDSTTTDPTTDPTGDPAPSDGTVNPSDEDQMTEDENVDAEDEDKDDDAEKEGKGKKKGHEKKHRFEAKRHGIEKAIESLLKARHDGRGEASNAALEAVIEKLKAMLKEDGTVETDDDAEDAVEETIETGITDGTASEDEVEVLVTIQVTKKQVEQAQTNVEAALEKNPKADKLYDLLRKVYKEKGDTKDIKIYVNGKQPLFDVKPYNKEGRNMVPVRAISEALGAKVGWDQATQTVIIIKDGVKIELPLGSNEIKVNGVAKTIDSSAEITNNRTMVPIRFISEFLGQQVDWDAATNMVVVK